MVEPASRNHVSVRKIKILGVPLDLGQRRRGVDMGPSALRAARLQDRLRLLGHEVEDMGNLPVVIPETQQVGDDCVRYLDEIADVCRGIANRVGQIADEASIPLLVGGDHSIAVGSLTGMARSIRKRQSNIGLIWLDAHADMNTPATTPSGSIHGMALACIIGHGADSLVQLNGQVPIVAPKNVALIGVRDIDRLEQANVIESGIHVFTMRDIDEQGLRGVIARAMEFVSRDTEGFHVSLDMDFVDPTEAPGVGTPCPGGITYREAHLAMEMIADSGQMLAFEVVEVNPILDTGNRTGLLAVELACSAFGKRIL